MTSSDDRINYLDYAATTPVRSEVLELMLPYFTEKFGNPSSLYSLAGEARYGLDEAREKVAAVLGARSSEIVFTGGGSESNNLAIKGSAMMKSSAAGHITTTAIEHHAVIHPVEQLEKLGYEATYVGVDSAGRIDPDEFAAAIRPDTFLASVMLVNNEVGTIQDVATIARRTREKSRQQGGEILIHTDAVQGAGKLSLNVDELGVDLLSLSGHKIYGPKGTGILYVRRGVELEPLIAGGGQERQRRSGTENVANIVGIGEALALAEAERLSSIERMRDLSDRLIAGVAERIRGSSFNGSHTHRVPEISNFSFPGVEGEPILLGLDFQGIAASSGSACSSASLEPSHVLMAMGVDPGLAVGSVRISMGRDTTETDIEDVLQALTDVVQQLETFPTAED
ncbi:MAG: cysteine desulfurase family protein [Dehalococcoidia bacterium]|jgi:cysteine desulfurase|nr:cysteine desulfurase NifS [Chloroflexota bacterium]MDP6056358.1 cysteine desulfurase family protein [Dehalococcoidia bacterium]MDP7090049.1 cysteine desulfurase family protein [Dehalococcoidia bacterium]MDP7261591.1 cysteine desulfurase family protein [Dehalococcoidia bacterium]MDP7485598.1 cysteine desulfurase family protein [Dehalococcoidia bacterium]|tara:strand:+ start:2980 stop:4170 length:1191 start_codon:yes stop_codon:yes gene_type:complete